MLSSSHFIDDEIGYITYSQHRIIGLAREVTTVNGLSIGRRNSIGNTFVLICGDGNGGGDQYIEDGKDAEIVQRLGFHRIDSIVLNVLRVCQKRCSVLLKILGWQ